MYNKQAFFTEPNDKGLSIALKREANIELNGIDSKTAKYDYIKDRYNTVLKILHIIEDTEPTIDSDIDYILDAITKIWKIGAIHPLTLNTDEFYPIPNLNGKYINTRVPHIFMKDNEIFDDNAYSLYVRACYIHPDNKQVEMVSFTMPQHRIYISKGGVITGEYIDECVIPKKVVEEHNYVIDNPITIPVCIIKDKKQDNIYVVDHRSPELRLLRKQYTIRVRLDEKIRDKKYNIRKYIKL